MNDVEIKEYDPNYDLYNELLLKKEEIKKEGYQYYMEYIRTFGELINKAYETKVECIKRKKLIEYYQAKINKNEDIVISKANDFINNVMYSYQKELEKMQKELVNAKAFTYCSSEEIRKIKQIYRKLAKLIHPDISKLYKKDLKIEDYWYSLCDAYENNRLEDIEELDVMICKYLFDKGYYNEEIKIDSIEEKINAIEKEIEDLQNTNPYLYKLILDDCDTVKSKKEELEEEIQDNEEYIRKLDIEISRLLDENGFSLESVYA